MKKIVVVLAFLAVMAVGAALADEDFVGFLANADLDVSGDVNAIDVQASINAALGVNLSGFTIVDNVNGGGIVKADPTGLTYDSGTVVRLTAVPDSGWQFARWEGDVTGSANPTNITMNGNKIVRAVFTELPHYTLTVTVSGSGSVTKSPDQADYVQGVSVSLTATPATGWRFDHWSDDAANNPRTVVMTSNKTLTAIFVEDLPDAPKITQQPVDWIGDAGDTASFSVTATGTGLTYQWYNSVGEIDWATSAEISFTADESYEGEYWCVVSNAGGDITSVSAGLYVNGLPEFRLTYTDGSGLIQADFNANNTELATFIIGGLAANEEVVGVGLAFMWPTTGPDHFAMEVERFTDPLPSLVFSDPVEFSGTDCVNSAGDPIADFSLEVSDSYLAYVVFEIRNTATSVTRIAYGNSDQIDMTLNGAPVALVGGNYELVLGGDVVKYTLTIETVGSGTVSAVAQ